MEIIRTFEQCIIINWEMPTIDLHNPFQHALYALKHYLTNASAARPRQRPLSILTTRRFLNRSPIHLQSNLNITIIRKLIPSREANLPSSVNRTTQNRDIVAILDQNGVIPIIRQVDGLDFGSSGLRYAEDAATTAARDDFVDENVGGVAAVGLAAVLVGHAECCIARSSSDVVAVDESDACVGCFLEEQTAFSNVLGYDRVDRQAIDVPCFNCVTTGAGNVNSVHLHVGVRSLVTIEANSQATAQVHGDLPKHKSLGPGESQTEVGVAGHAKVWNLYIGGVRGLDGTPTTLVPDIDGAAALEDLAAGNGDGVGADGSRSNDRDALSARNRGPMLLGWQLDSRSRSTRCWNLWSR